jgi:hypothetical protein
MTELRQSNIYQINQDLLNENLIQPTHKNKVYCRKGMLKCLGIIIFLSGISSLNFYLGVIYYQNHLEDKDGSL